MCILINKEILKNFAKRNDHFMKRNGPSGKRNCSLAKRNGPNGKRNDLFGKKEKR